MEQRPRIERDRLTQLTYLMLGLWGFLLYAFGPALPALRRQLDVSRATVSLHTTVVALGAILVGVAGDRVVARLGRRRTFWVTATAVAAAALGLATGGRLPLTLAAAAVLGVGGALLVAIIQASLADRHGVLAPAALVESTAVSTALGALAPFAVALAIFAGGDWRAVFVAASFVAVPALALAYGSVAFPAAPELPHGHDPKLPARYWVYWTALLLFVAIEFCIVFWSTDFFESERELAPSRAAAASSLFLVGMTLGRLAGGVVARHVPAERLLAVAIAVAAAGFGSYWLVPQAAISVAGLGVAGVGVALLYPLTLALALRAAAGRTDAATARAAFAAGIAIAVAPFALGAIADAAGLGAAHAIVPLLMLAAVGALAAAHRSPSAAQLP